MTAGQDTTQESIRLLEEQTQDLMRQLDLLGGSRIQEDISYGQYKVLSVINGEGPISVGNLGRFVGSAQSTTSEMIARLTKAGLVTKVRGPYDGRVVMVELTEQGRNLMMQRRQAIYEGYQSLFEKLSIAEQAKFMECVVALNKLLRKFSE